MIDIGDFLIKISDVLWYCFMERFNSNTQQSGNGLDLSFWEKISFWKVGSLWTFVRGSNCG